MSAIVVAFFLFGSVTLAGAVGAVTLKNVSHALLALVVMFMGVAALFFTLHADFIGVTQILVYVGAVAVLIVFAIVLTRSHEGPDALKLGVSGGFRYAGALMAGITGALLIAAIAKAPEAAKTLPGKAPVGSADEVGNALMKTYAIPFELASLLLTAALIGAVVVAMDEVQRHASKKTSMSRGVR